MRCSVETKQNTQQNTTKYVFGAVIRRLHGQVFFGQFRRRKKDRCYSVRGIAADQEFVVVFKTVVCADHFLRRLSFIALQA